MGGGSLDRSKASRDGGRRRRGDPGRGGGDGPRRSILLAGRVGASSPYAWEGNARTIQKHLGSTFKRLGGSGLEGPELDALVAYVKAMPGPANRSGPDAETLTKGEKIFFASKTGCSGCHAGAGFTDGKMHDVKSGRAFNTPSLLNVGAAGPFFHDGRYATIEDLLKDVDGKMGRTKGLSAAELGALSAYVKSL